MSERVPAEDFEPESCEIESCSAPNGNCLSSFNLGWSRCKFGPMRNYTTKVQRREVERRLTDRRAAQPPTERDTK